jgi:hypothetical protein
VVRQELPREPRARRSRVAVLKPHHRPRSPWVRSDRKGRPVLRQHSVEGQPGAAQTRLGLTSEEAAPSPPRMAAGAISTPPCHHPVGLGEARSRASSIGSRVRTPTPEPALPSITPGHALRGVDPAPATPSGGRGRGPRAASPSSRTWRHPLLKPRSPQGRAARAATRVAEGAVTSSSVRGRYSGRS